MIRKPMQDAYDPLPPFVSDYWMAVEDGLRDASTANVRVVGLARNCREQLLDNLDLIEMHAHRFGSLRLHVVENDSDDGTDEALLEWCGKRDWASCHTLTLGRQQRSTEFQGPRTTELAEYRTLCQQMVATDTDFVIVLDMDTAWWSVPGMFHGIGMVQRFPSVWGSASVSMAEHMMHTIHGEKLGIIHYDAWALRLNSWWDDYQGGLGGWKHYWFPAIGSPAVPVCSAFGGLCVYRAKEYLSGVYSGDDCEHVTFHRSIYGKHGGSLVINPAQRTMMRYLSEVSDGGSDGDDQSG